MATIRKRGDTWEVMVRIKGHAPIYAYFTKKTLADDWAVKKEAEIKDGRYFDTKEAKTARLVDLFDRYQYEVAPAKEASSQSSIKARIGTLKREFPNTTLASLSVDDVLSFVDKRQKKVSDDAIRKELQLLADLVDSAMVLWGYRLPANPVPTAKRILRKLRKLKPGNSRERRLRPGEYAKIRDAKHNHFTLINEVALFAIETGMRQGEIASARREYVDLEKRIIYVPKSKMDWLTGNKGKVVPLSPLAIKIIESLPVWFIDGTLFGMQSASIKRAFSRLCKKEKLIDLHFHDLCHEATSRLFEAGFRIEEVSAVTGKKDWRTLKRYTHPDPEKLAQKMQDHSDKQQLSDNQHTSARVVRLSPYKSG